MGQFIEEVQKINQNYNHKYKISEERDNVRNTLYKRFYREFKKRGDDYDDTYNYLANIRKKDEICMKEYDFGTHVTWEFVDTTYYKQLKKIYKIFKEHERVEKIQEEQGVTNSLEIVFDKNGRMDTKATYERHVKNCKPYDSEIVGDKKVLIYRVLDRNGKPYDFRVFFFKDIDVIDLISTTHKLEPDGMLQGIKLKGSNIFLIPILLVGIPIALLMFTFKAFLILALIFFLIIISAK